ncbi:MAG: DUF2892 domain-containing protein [Nitrospirae bacterium]|jgi:hypothetical protein|nr:DUF2892 domain-containing protein [Nitrospirota bacterium]
MKINESTLDRVLRILVGLTLISLVFVGPRTPWGWIGILLLATGLIGFCPVTHFLGIRTCPVRKKVVTGPPR